MEPGERIALRRSMAVREGNRITVRPSRGQLVAPLVQVAIALVALWLMIALFDRLPLLVLALLLVVVILLGPVAALGFVFGLFGSSMVVDGAKRSAHWQQGFLGLGIGTTTSVALERIASVEVRGDFDDEFTYGGRPDMVTWDVELVRDDGRRLQVGSVVVARPLADEGLERANRLAAAIAAMSDAQLRPAALPVEELLAAADEPEPMPRRRLRRVRRQALPPPGEAGR